MTNEQLQAILDREYKGLDASGLGFTALDIVDDLAEELLSLRKKQDVKDVFRVVPFYRISYTEDDIPDLEKLHAFFREEQFVDRDVCGPLILFNLTQERYERFCERFKTWLVDEDDKNERV